MILAEWFLNSFLSDASTWLVYLAIAGLFLVCLFRCVIPVWETRRILRRAAHLIKKNEKDDSAAWQEETFLGKGALYAHWSEYLNNLFFADGAYHNPSNVEDYINEDTAIYGPGRVALSDAAPGLMVSLGFLGTLIGISLGLRGFSMDSMGEVTEAIKRLIPNMQYAFNTSIAGVVGSILFTVVSKSAHGGAQRALSAFYAAMNKFAGIASVDPMTQIAIYQQEQTTLLQGIAKEMSGALADRMAQAVERSLLPLREDMDGFMASATKEQLRGVDAIVQRFLARMDESMGGQFDVLAKTMNAVGRNQYDMQQGIAASVEGVRAMAKDLSEAQRVSESLLGDFGEYVQKLGAAQQAAGDDYQRIASNAEHLEIVAHQQNQYLQTVGKLQSEMNKTAETMREAMEKLMSALDAGVQKQTSALSDTSTALQKAGDTLSRSGDALLGGVSRDIDRTYNQFFEKINETAERLGWMVEDVRITIAKLPDLLDGAAELYAGQAERLTEALRGAQQALDEAADRLAR